MTSSQTHRHPKPRQPHAVNVFLALLSACLLISALAAAPYLATSPDFAHQHPEDTPPHFHNLDVILGPTLMVTAFTPTIIVSALIILLVVAYQTIVIRSFIEPANRGRAPPPSLF